MSKGKHIFISYSHKNTNKVMDIVQSLKSANYALWYDEEIVPGKKYADHIALHLKSCTCFMAFITKEYIESRFCQDELTSALDFNKEIILVYMDDVELPPGLSLRVCQMQKILYYKSKNDQWLLSQIARNPDIEICKTASEYSGTSPYAKGNIKGNNKRISKVLGAVCLLCILAAIYIILKPGSEPSGHEHVWKAATCTSPLICTECGATSGSPAGHSWSEATCSVPSTCSECGVTQGTALSHQWTEASYFAPKTCSLCGATEGTHIVDIVAGDTITMGHYGDEEIVWIVLEYDSETNQALLISKYCLDAVPFHVGEGYGSWENSSLRKWLNNEFISKAFDQEERDVIVSKPISTPGNPDFGTTGGDDSLDRVFVLSIEEVVYYFPSKTSRQCEPTAYCSAQGCYDPVEYAQKHGTELDEESIGHTCWWLRTAGIDDGRAANVFASGTVSTYGAYKYSNDVAVRPAMWVQLG